MRCAANMPRNRARAALSRRMPRPRAGHTSRCGSARSGGFSPIGYVFAADSLPSVAKLTHSRRFHCQSGEFSRATPTNIYSSTENAPNVGLGCPWAARRSFWWGALPYPPSGPRCHARRQRCRRTSRHSWQWASWQSFRPAESGTLNRSPSQSQSWRNQSWKNCNVFPGSALVVGPSPLSRRPGHNNQKFRRLTCRTLSKPSWSSASSPSSPPASRPRPKSRRLSRWSLPSRPRARCKTTLGSALRAGPTLRVRPSFAPAPVFADIAAPTGPGCPC